MQVRLSKLIVICGPTASGKTDLAISLAKKFNGEIVNADSRQIYREMNIATAKPVFDTESKSLFEGCVLDGIKHYLFDIVDPDDFFTLADYKSSVLKVIKKIVAKNKIPFLVGGTGLYIKAVVDNLDIPKVEPNLALRKELENKTLEELTMMLKEKDLETYRRIDLKNLRRVIRALEVILSTGESFAALQKKGEPLFNVLQIGIKINREVLNKRIDERCKKMLEAGLVQETKKLAQKYSWKLPSMSGIGYRQMRGYIEGKITLEEALDWFKKDSRHYAKRQMTWFKKDKRIYWVENEEQAEKLISKFIA